MRILPTLQIDAGNFLTLAADLPHAVEEGGQIKAAIRRLRDAGEAPFLTLPFDDIEPIQRFAADLARQFPRCYVLGIGGSSLGGEMLVRVLGRGDREVRFFDNIDPLWLEALHTVDWAQAALFVISKSGETAETLAQFLSLLPELERQLGNRLRDHVYAITERPGSTLGMLAAEMGLTTIAHPRVGGRFSVLSVVGLLPAAYAGVDVAALLKGARTVVDDFFSDTSASPVVDFTLAQLKHAQHGARHITVFMPYAQRLRTMGLWFRQLWAESLGKIDANGAPQGWTPVSALGVTDQHSQLQLYLDGPDDKQFTLLFDEATRHVGEPIPSRFTHLPGVKSLVDHRVGDLLFAEYRATCETLVRHRRPVRKISLDTRDAASLGALIMLLELETVAVAVLLGIDAFDQPAVEEGKRLASEYLRK